MVKTYKNPPLLEAVCEFRFILEDNCSESQFDTFYEKIKSNFPLKKKGKMHQLQFKIDADKTPEDNKQSFQQDFYEFEQYLSEDEKYSVQLDGNRVSIHRIKPYTTWSNFLPFIQNVYKSYIESFNPIKLERAGIRYVNEIIIPIDGFLFTDYFTINASLPSLEKNTQLSVFLGSVFEQESGQDAIKVQFVEKKTVEQTLNRAFVLDFDYFLVNPVVTFDNIDTWLNTAHTNLENVFEGMIKDKTRELFEK